MGLPAMAPPPPLQGPGSQRVPSPKAQRARVLLQQLLQTQPQQAVPPGAGQDVGSGEDVGRMAASPALQGAFRTVGAGAALADVDQNTLPGLTPSQAVAFCGPAAVLDLMRQYQGQDTIPAEAVVRKAQEVDPRTRRPYWQGQMNGPQEFANLLDEFGFEPQMINLAGGNQAEGWRQVESALRRGQRVAIDTPGHYYQAQSIDDQGRMTFGDVVGQARGPMTRDEITSRGGYGAPRTAITAAPRDPNVRLLSAEGQQGGGLNPTEQLVVDTAQQLGVDPALALGVAQQESGLQHERAPGQVKVSPAGARGLMQLMPGTARGLGVDPDNLAQNVEGGVRYLRDLLQQHGGDVERALGAYNGGPRGANPATRAGETRAYIPAVQNYAQQWSARLQGASGGRNPLQQAGDLAAQGLGWLQDRIAQAGGLLEPPTAYAAPEAGANVPEAQLGVPQQPAAPPSAAPGPPMSHTGRTYTYTGPPSPSTPTPTANVPLLQNPTVQAAGAMLRPGVQTAGAAASALGTTAQNVAGAARGVYETGNRIAGVAPSPPAGAPAPAPAGPQWGTTPGPVGPQPPPPTEPTGPQAPETPPVAAGPAPAGAYVGADGEHYSSITDRPYWGTPHQTIQSNGLIVGYYGDAEEQAGGRGRLHEMEQVTDPQSLEAKQWAAIWKRQQDEYDRATPTASQTSEQAIARDRLNAEIINRQALLDQHEADRASREGIATENRASREFEAEQNRQARAATTAQARQQVVGSAAAGYQTTLGDVQRMGGTGIAFSSDGSAAHILGPDGRPLQTVNLGAPRPAAAQGQPGFQERYNPDTGQMEQSPMPGAPSRYTVHNGAVVEQPAGYGAPTVASMLPLQVSTSTDDFGRVIQIRPDGEMRVLSDGAPKVVTAQGRSYLQYPPAIPRYSPPQTQQQPYGYAQTPATGAHPPEALAVLAQLGITPESTVQVPRALVDHARSLGWRPLAEQAGAAEAAAPSPQFADYGAPASATGAPPFSGAGPGYLPPPRPPAVPDEVTDATDIPE